MSDPIDWTDPCAVAAVLRPAYYQLLAGAAAARVRIENREVQFVATSITDLKAELANLDAQCAIANGEPSKRRAIRAGALFRDAGWFAGFVDESDV